MKKDNDVHEENNVDNEIHERTIRELLRQVSERNRISSLLKNENEKLAQQLAQKTFKDNDILKSIEAKKAEFDIAIEKAQKAILDRDNQITALNGQLQEESSRTKTLELSVADRDSQIAALNGQLQKAIDRIRVLEPEISKRDDEITMLNGQLQQLTYQAQALDKEVAEMRDSILWQFVTGCHNNIIERTLPHCTKRRAVYDLGLKSGRILVKEGFEGLWWHYNERKRVKTFENGMGLQPKRETKSINNNVVLEDLKLEKIIFPKLVADPEVSIVIPIYNNSKYTYNCLKSILKTKNSHFEIVAVDDASYDETSDLLRNIENIQIVKNDNNQGFIRSCNKGAKLSHGKYILFLNNDTIVTENWLENLLEVIKKDQVGVVGAKLIYPDGKLQEAGDIVWDDASAWNYGKGDDPDKPEYNFVREVDYCSGAALLIWRDLFEKIGGFDERFNPAYYEDVDLCFSIRNLGYKVLYQPRSVIIHFEGVSSGTDLISGAKKYQGINRAKFLEKWKNILVREHHKPDSRNLFLARVRRRTGKNILVIDHYVPTFDKDAGSYRMYNFLKIMVDLGHKVTFIGDNHSKIEPYTTILQQYGVEVLYEPYIQSIEEYLAENGKYYDIVILSRAHIAKDHIYTARKYCNKAKIVFDTVDLQFLRELRRSEVENNQVIFIESEKLKELELRLARLSDVTLVVSPVEKEILMKEEPSLRIDVISLIQEVKTCKTPFSERKDILFLGGFGHPPNADAVNWFAKEIFPIIKEQIAGIKFYVIGNTPPKEINSLASEDIIVTGFVEDLTPYFDKCRVFVAPLRYGSGVKGKITQSMSFGLPVVTTVIGAEGIGLEDGINALIANEPKKFAEKVMMLYKDEELWNKLSEKSIENVADNFSYEVATIMIKNLIETLSSAKIMHEANRYDLTGIKPDLNENGLIDHLSPHDESLISKDTLRC